MFKKLKHKEGALQKGRRTRRSKKRRIRRSTGKRSCELWRVFAWFSSFVVFFCMIFSSIYLVLLTSFIFLVNRILFLFSSNLLSKSPSRWPIIFFQKNTENLQRCFVKKISTSIIATRRNRTKEIDAVLDKEEEEQEKEELKKKQEDEEEEEEEKD